MTFAIDRRLLLKAGTVGLGALAMPGGAQLLAARGFTHDVASGEPRAEFRDAVDPLRAGVRGYGAARLSALGQAGFRLVRRPRHGHRRSRA